jgi:hypothetical protein
MYVYAVKNAQMFVMLHRINVGKLHVYWIALIAHKGDIWLEGPKEKLSRPTANTEKVIYGMTHPRLLIFWTLTFLFYCGQERKTGDIVNILNRAGSVHHRGILEEIKCASFLTDLYESNWSVEHRVSVAFHALCDMFGMYLSASVRGSNILIQYLFSFCLVFSE